MAYASMEDLETIWRQLTDDEKLRAEPLLDIVAASLRTEAYKVGKDLDAMAAADPDFALVLKSVTVDVIGRYLMTGTDAEPMTQMSESAGNVSVSGTYLIPGGGLFIKKSELARLGLRRQRYGVMEFYGDE